MILRTLIFLIFANTLISEISFIDRIAIIVDEGIIMESELNEALENKNINDLCGYNIIKSEKKFGINTRFDFLLNDTKHNKKAFLEVKSVSLSRKKGYAEFPDAVTSRGKKHLENLILANEQGYNCYLLFLVQIENCDSFGIASDIDPEYFKYFKQAIKKNVKVLCYDCKFSNKSIEMNNKIKILLND